VSLHDAEIVDVAAGATAGVRDTAATGHGSLLAGFHEEARLAGLEVGMERDFVGTCEYHMFGFVRDLLVSFHSGFTWLAFPNNPSSVLHACQRSCETDLGDHGDLAPPRRG
jgi:hypothetical protein